MRGFTAGRVLALAALAFWGCGGGDATSGGFGTGGTGAGGSSGASGSSGTAGEPPLGCSSATYCGPGGFVCGVHAVPNATCGEVDCGTCRFRGADVSPGDITAAPDRSIHMAAWSATDRALLYSRVGAAGLETETIASDAAGETASIAVADDGTVHVAYVTDTDQVMHAVKHPGDATFTASVAIDVGQSVKVAVDAAGAPHLVVVGENPQTRQQQLLHVTKAGDTYAATPIAGVAPIGDVSVARGEDGTIVAAVRSDLRELAVMELIDGEFVRDTSVPVLDDQPAEWSATVTSDGIRIAVVLGNYTLLTGSTLVELSREGGTWTVTSLGVSQVTHGMALASGPNDALHLAYYAYRTEGLLYTRPGSPRFLNLHSQCEDGDVRMAIDADDQPHFLLGCSSASGYLAPIERRSDEYVAACNESAELICSRACTCGVGSDCCYGDGQPDGSNGCTFGPNNAGHDLCVERMKIGLCSDLTADPAELFACQPVLEADTASMCFEDGYVIPPVCYSLIQSNY